MSNIYGQQDITDAVRFSTDNIEGTARFKALSGAFGALGGDLSAVSLNPAGSAVFNESIFSASISNFDIDNTTTYLGTINSNNTDSSFDLNQAGAVFIFNNRDEDSPWRKVTIGLTYEQTQNFDNSFFASGTNSNSIDRYFLANAQGLRLDEISVLDGETFDEAYGEIGSIFGFRNQQALLAFESFIIDPVQDLDDNIVYTSNIDDGDAINRFSQEFSSATRGNNGKLTFNAAIQHKNNIYLGVNLNSHFINFDRTTFFFEENDNPGSQVREVAFENNLSTTGAGFSFQLGGIAKLNDFLRVGFTYDSPIWYTIDEESTQALSVLSDGFASPDIFAPQIINVFPDYRLRTPGKITASAALVINKSGLISFDYSRKDFGNIRFNPSSDSNLAIQNNLINQNLTSASTYRIGGEYRFNNWSYRGGYRFEESPYSDTDFYGNLTGFSLGLGYDFGGTKIDFAYQNSNREINSRLFNGSVNNNDANGFTDTTRIDADNSSLTLTLTMSL
ncbi:transporter [Flavobacteriaceae bacterium AU392]|nr:transporter [Flavobacteriaceae bacterium]RKM81282.1 transporter [Flavobacteriaceae bacterium AU392]